MHGLQGQIFQKSWIEWQVQPKTIVYVNPCGGRVGGLEANLRGRLGFLAWVKYSDHEKLDVTSWEFGLNDSGKVFFHFLNSFL